MATFAFMVFCSKERDAFPDALLREAQESVFSYKWPKVEI